MQILNFQIRPEIDAAVQVPAGCWCDYVDFYDGPDGVGSYPAYMLLRNAAQRNATVAQASATREALLLLWPIDNLAALATRCGDRPLNYIGFTYCMADGCDFLMYDLNCAIAERAPYPQGLPAPQRLTDPATPVRPQSAPQPAQPSRRLIRPSEEVPVPAASPEPRDSRDMARFSRDLSALRRLWDGRRNYKISAETLCWIWSKMATSRSDNVQFVHMSNMLNSLVGLNDATLHGRLPIGMDREVHDLIDLLQRSEIRCPDLAALLCSLLRDPDPE